MITVRDTRSGLALTYNTAYWVEPASSTSGHHVLYTKDPAEGGEFIVRLPGTVAIEFVDPCKVEATIQDLTIRSALRLLRRSIRRAENRYDVAMLKRELRDFNAHTYTWK